jgi:ribosomal protein S18 acetylase RimI-like enzyme
MDGIEVAIQPAGVEDEDAVVALWKSCGLTVPYNDPAADFRFARAKTNSDVLIGRDGSGAVVGSVMVGHDGHRGWVYYVAAHPERRGQGIGSSMMRAAEDWLHARNVVKVQLMIRETNTQVAEFYTRSGYEAIPRVVMQKWLTQGRRS